MEIEKTEAEIDWQAKERIDVDTAVSAFSRIANRSSSTKLFIQSMSNEHRTLQQAMTGYMLAWFKHLSELKENQYDPRNEASVRIAKKIIAVTEGVTRLPLI